MLLIASVTFLVCERLALKVVPYPIAEVMASNIGGAATLVGDPPNIITASRADLSFNDFLVNLPPLIVDLIVAFCLLCRWLFRSAFVYDETAPPPSWPCRKRRPSPTGGSSGRASPCSGW
ncbi:SLC13 family permease [Actinomadura sp. NPDC048021]|uniref:SLC13 family permease n=1 Tax=Actinomadura sp. NPDC048021 TaxID=3155385 RepID=UPI0033C7E4E3